MELLNGVCEEFLTGQTPTFVGSPSRTSSNKLCNLLILLPTETTATPIIAFVVQLCL